MVKTHTLNGIKRIIDLDKVEGLCIHPNNKPSIHIVMGLPYNECERAREGLITLLEESLHSELPNTREKIVNRTAKEIGKLLWRLGYRRTKK